MMSSGTGGVVCGGVADVDENNNNQLMVQLGTFENETEEKLYRDCSSGKLFKTFAYTDRAVLARAKIVLKQTLGKGTYSKVKQAYDLANLREIAVKIIDCSKAPKDFQEKFLPRELDVWPRVSHPNVIHMYDYIINEEKIYMILEYANGGDMLSYIQSICGPVGERDCKQWMRQILSAVAYLHQMNIIHRDLKLENLLIDSSTRMIKLCDFGFAKDLGQQQDELSRTYCGSKAYASPEILLGQPYDPKKADVWAVGVIFFIFLTGNMPFKEDKCNQFILNQHKSLRLYWVRNYKVAPTAKSLIKSIFTYEWTKRPTIDDVLNNEWFLNKPLDQTTNTQQTTTVTSTIDYNLRSRFRGSKRACCATSGAGAGPTDDKHRQIKTN